MDCPLCGGGTTVCDSRPEIDCVNRRRRCLSCDHRFATIEIETDMLKSWENAHKQTQPKPVIDVEGVKKAVRLLNTFLEGVNK